MRTAIIWTAIFGVTLLFPALWGTSRTLDRYDGYSSITSTPTLHPMVGQLLAKGPQGGNKKGDAPPPSSSKARGAQSGGNTNQSENLSSSTLKKLDYTRNALRDKF
jgi:hypothetical protein